MAIGQTTVSFSAVGSEASSNAATPTPVPVQLVYSYTLGVGATTGNADQLWRADRNVNNGSNDDLDLNGALAVLFGGNLAAVKLVGLFIVNNSKTSGDKLIIGNEGTNPLYVGLFGSSTSTAVCSAGGFVNFFHPIDPATVTAGTGDKLRINNPGATPISYSIFAITRSA